MTYEENKQVVCKRSVLLIKFPKGSVWIKLQRRGRNWHIKSGLIGLGKSAQQI